MKNFVGWGGGWWYVPIIYVFVVKGTGDSI